MPAGLDACIFSNRRHRILRATPARRSSRPAMPFGLSSHCHIASFVICHCFSRNGLLRRHNAPACRRFVTRSPYHAQEDEIVLSMPMLPSGFRAADLSMYFSTQAPCPPTFRRLRLLARCRPLSVALLFIRRVIFARRDVDASPSTSRRVACASHTVGGTPSST